MRILVAEDDSYTRRGLIEVFEREGYEVVSAETGTKALELFSTALPDLVCLDIMMPGMNGYEVCREIRKGKNTTPVLFISAKSEEIDKVVGLELGADDYITKPFGVREVLARVKAISRRYSKPADAPSPPFTIRELKVVPSEMKAYRGNESFELTQRDVKILSHFESHKGQVISRNDLFDVGWGLDYLPSSRSLDQYISQLRKKIERDPKEPQIIETVHGAGYRCQ